MCSNVLRLRTFSADLLGICLPTIFAAITAGRAAARAETHWRVAKVSACHRCFITFTLLVTSNSMAYIQFFTLVAYIQFWNSAGLIHIAQQRS